VTHGDAKSHTCALDTYRHIQTHTDTYRHIQTHTDAYRHVQTHADTCRLIFYIHTPAYADLFITQIETHRHTDIYTLIIFITQIETHRYIGA
jgi:hypothetical protein